MPGTCAARLLTMHPPPRLCFGRRDSRCCQQHKHHCLPLAALLPMAGLPRAVLGVGSSVLAWCCLPRPHLPLQHCLLLAALLPLFALLLLKLRWAETTLASRRLSGSREGSCLQSQAGRKRGPRSANTFETYTEHAHHQAVAEMPPFLQSKQHAKAAGDAVVCLDRIDG